MNFISEKLKTAKYSYKCDCCQNVHEKGSNVWHWVTTNKQNQTVNYKCCKSHVAMEEEREHYLQIIKEWEKVDPKGPLKAFIKWQKAQGLI